MMLRKIVISSTGVDKDFSLLGYDAVSIGK
jgi:hypothetical protein